MNPEAIDPGNSLVKKQGLNLMLSRDRMEILDFYYPTKINIFDIPISVF